MHELLYAVISGVQDTRTGYPSRAPSTSLLLLACLLVIFLPAFAFSTLIPTSSTPVVMRSRALLGSSRIFSLHRSHKLACTPPLLLASTSYARMLACSLCSLLHPHMLACSRALFLCRACSLSRARILKLPVPQSWLLSQIFRACVGVHCHSCACCVIATLFVNAVTFPMSERTSPCSHQETESSFEDVIFSCWKGGCIAGLTSAWWRVGSTASGCYRQSSGSQRTIFSALEMVGNGPRRPGPRFSRGEGDG